MAKKLPRGFYWRGGIVWVRTDPITGKPCSTRCKTKSAAELWFEERERLAASPNYAASLSATVGRWVNRTLAHKRSREKSDGTLHMYEIKLGHVVRIFGADSPMAVITPAAVEDYVTQRKSEGVKNNTIARELTCLRQMLKLARHQGEFALVPEEVMPVGFSAEYKPVKRTLPWEQLPRLLAALPEHRRAWVAYAVATAGDVSDVERARPEDFDPVTRTIQMRGTKNEARTAPIPLLPWFESMFLWAHSRMPLDPWPRVSKDLPELTRRLGLGHITPKDLRRSVSTWLSEEGVAESLISRFMRHRSNTMVRTVYGQVKPVALGKLIDEHLQSRSVTGSQQPLGGMADAGDLKATARHYPNANYPTPLGPNRALPGVNGTGFDTETLQSSGYPPGGFAHDDLEAPTRPGLARAAYRCGVLPRCANA